MVAGRPVASSKSEAAPAERQYLLERLSGKVTSYLFTDVSPAFCPPPRRSSSRLEKPDAFIARRLDIEAIWTARGSIRRGSISSLSSTFCMRHGTWRHHCAMSASCSRPAERW